MKLAELFQDLSFGELSNLGLANDGNGTITDGAKPRILRYANDGLLRLYTRFPLKEDSLLVRMSKEVTFYHLLPRFAVNYVPAGSEDSEDVRYILDLPNEPFTGDVVKPLAVFDQYGCKVPLNDEQQPTSVFTPQANLLQVPVPVDLQVLNVLYQAKHPRLTGDVEQEIDLPEILWGALTAFVAYKIFSHMNTQDSTAKAQEHLGIYEAICSDVVDKDLVNTSTSTTNTRFHSRGWI